MNPLINDTFIAPPCQESLGIVYEDESLLVINKPSGLLSLSGKNPANLDSVHYRLVQQWPTAQLIHRLDFGTSGLLVVALSQDIAKALNRQFQQRQVTKRYFAMLQGLVDADSGLIDAPIGKDPLHFPKVKICSVTGKPALTEYAVIERFPEQETTLIAYTPLTGRTHQLRIHSAHIGHPILGCDLYGTTETKTRASRLLLQACDLSFIHPVSGEALSFRQALEGAFDSC